VSYYGYLPAYFIYNDLSLKFVDQNPDFFNTRYWPAKTSTGKRVIKTTMGLGIMYSPFFLVGNHIAKTFHIPATGYSSPYQVSLLIGALFYLLLGLFYLRKLLLMYFSEMVTAITIFCVYFGTNLVWYSTSESLMPHAFLFSLISILLYVVVKWHNKPGWLNSLCVGFLLGLLMLIRPTMILLVIPFLLFRIKDLDSFKEKIKFFQKNFRFIIIMPFAFFLVLLPQFVYWHYVSGSYLYYSYSGEKFYWTHPHILEGLFGFRKGWLVYTPVMLFSVLGLFFLNRKTNDLKSGVIVTFLIGIFIIFSWWAWWYGGSFGLRAMIDLYGLMAIPFASFVEYIFSKKKIVRFTFMLTTSALIYINLFQNWQFQNGLIHYDGMNREVYFMGATKIRMVGSTYDS
jgi:hypothetical protein